MREYGELGGEAVEGERTEVRETLSESVAESLS
jgi:hypothetical protein